MMEAASSWARLQGLRGESLAAADAAAGAERTAVECRRRWKPFAAGTTRCRVSDEEERSLYEVVVGAMLGVDIERQGPSARESVAAEGLDGISARR